MRNDVKACIEPLYQWLCALAVHGEPCPTNADIADRFGLSSCVGVSLLKALEQDQLIRIKRHQNWRVLTITATGQKIESASVNTRRNQPKKLPTVKTPKQSPPPDPDRLFLRQQQSRQSGSVVNWRTYGIVAGFNAKLSDGCKWIESDPIVELRAIPPRDPFCGAPRLSGKSYCAKHHPRTFVTIKRRGESEEPEQPKVAA